MTVTVRCDLMIGEVFNPSQNLMYMYSDFHRKCLKIVHGILNLEKFWQTLNVLSKALSLDCNCPAFQDYSFYFGTTLIHWVK